ncbi:MAG: phosphoribosylanthranilate isomerase [Kofleriaceae bacterium]|nr:phosphoribosylanthranilate isomerase [Kofleriaceae bacterium]
MNPRTKICGVTLPDDAAHAAAAGADYLGLNFWPSSKRYLAAEHAPLVADAARAAGVIQLVGVFVDARLDDIVAIAAAVSLDVIQLHGSESAADVAKVAAATRRPVWKAIPVASYADVQRLETWVTEAVLLDTPSAGRGGSGATFDWSLARRARQAYPARRLVLAGGLDPTNVARAVAEVAPFAVDVASGVEAAPGIKDPAKVTAFIAAARGL